MKVSGAQAVVACLLEQGVDTVFGYPGGQVIPLYDALYNSSLQHVLTVHEQGAAHAADGYARVSGRVGVCIATSGPGATNLITGLAAAYLDSVPVVAICGQVATGALGRDSFQEVNITGISKSITKQNFLITDPTTIPEFVRSAFQIASSGRPGPVLIDLPCNLQTASLEFTEAKLVLPVQVEPSEEMITKINQAATALEQSQRPVLVLGGGVIRGKASEHVQLFIEKCGLPVVSTLMGLGGISSTHPQFLGLTGMHGHKVANNAIRHADLIIAIGSRFNDRVTGDRQKYLGGKTLIHIDVDQSEIGKNIRADIALVGELKKIVSLLVATCRPKKVSSWWERLGLWKREFKERYHTEYLNAPWMMQEISEQVKGQQVILVTDVGQHQMWAAQHLKIETSGTWLTSGGLGAMGFGLPAAMGAQLASPEKRAILIAGDGGFKMTAMELYTIAAYNIPVIAIIVDNGCLGMVRQWQQLFYEERYSSSLAARKMDFVGQARACGVEAEKVSTPGQFKKVFAAAWNKRSPIVIVAEIALSDMVTPMMAPGASIGEYVIIE